MFFYFILFVLWFFKWGDDWGWFVKLIVYKLVFYGVLKIDLLCWDISNGYSIGLKDFGRKKNRWGVGGVGYGLKDGIWLIILCFS